MQPSSIPLNQQQPFSYVATFTLTANQSLTQTLILDQDSTFDFQALEIVSSQDTNNSTLLNNCTFLLKDASGGRYFSSGPLPRFTAAGVAAQNVLNEGRAIRFPQKNQLEITVTDTSGSSNTVTVVFKGYKIFV